MPSWNIHLAHAERLLEGGGSVARAVRDRNAFLFGNLIPDIYVGYMVPGVVRPVPYRVTHFAKPEHIPKPRAGEFFDKYVLPLAREAGAVLDAAAAVEAGAACRPGAAVCRVTGVTGAGRPGSDGAGCAGVAVCRDVEVAADGQADAASRPETAGPFRFGSNAAEGSREAHPGSSRACYPWWNPASLSAEVAHVSPAHTPTFEWEFDVRGTAACQRDELAAAQRPLSPDELRRSLFDMVLGTWVHLLADCTWNQAVSDLLDARGEKPSRDFRIKKQGDFDLFGKSLELDLMPRLTPQLIEVAAAFPQYEIDAASVAATCAIAHETARTNHPVTGAEYRLLDEAFFNRVFAEVNARAERKMGQFEM